MNAETILCPVRRWADATPESLALLTPEHTWTWADLDRRVTEEEGILLDSTVPGFRLAVHAPNSPDLVVLVLAALRTGHVLAPFSTRWPEASVHKQLARIGCDGLLDLTKFRHPASTVHSPRPILLHRPATIIFTSGSTGRPKAVLHTVGNHVMSARGIIEALGLRPGDHWLLDLPLYHVGGLAIVYRCALAGATMVLPAPQTPTAEAFQHFAITHASLVATQLYRLLQATTAPLATLRALLLGGSAIPPGLLDDAHARGWPVHTSYGLTEMASTVTMTPPAGPRSALATSGRLLAHRGLAIRDGEIVVRGATRFAGYVEGEHLLEPFDATGWFATGDLGEVDTNGWLRVTGRKDNQFISGGENVQPEAIEAALAALPEVARAVVVPIDDEEFGQRPVAFVQMIEGCAPDGAALREALANTLPRFMRPVAVHSWPVFQEGLKPDRRALEAEAERLKKK